MGADTSQEKSEPSKSTMKSAVSDKPKGTTTKDSTNKIELPICRRGETFSESLREDETTFKEFTEMTFGSLNLRSPDVDREAERWAAEQMGLNTCILGSKIVHLLILLTICILSFVFESQTLGWTFFALLLVDLIVLGLSIGHLVRSHLGVLLALIGVESLIAITGIVMAITVMWKDNGKDCEHDNCALDLSAKERFFFFWFLLVKGMLELFLALMIVAMSPIIHDRNQDEWTTHHSNHFGHEHTGADGGYKDWSAFLSPGTSSSKTDTKLNGAFDEDSA